MPYKRCIPCCGSGKVMGGGMITADCDYCEGRGKVYYQDDELAYLEKHKDAIKTSDSYKDSKDKLKKKLQVSDEKAEELLDKALQEK